LLFQLKKNKQIKSKKQCAVVRWLTKTMTKNNRVGGKPFFILFFCVGGWVIISSVSKKNIYFLPLLFSLSWV
jgi:hypothetical protein